MFINIKGNVQCCSITLDSLCTHLQRGNVTATLPDITQSSCLPSTSSCVIQAHNYDIQHTCVNLYRPDISCSEQTLHKLHIGCCFTNGSTLNSICFNIHSPLNSYLIPYENFITHTVLIINSFLQC